MRAYITELVTQSLGYLQREGGLSLPDGMEEKIRIEYARDRSHGDYACNIAMILAGLAGRPPREIAAMIAERLPESRRVKRWKSPGPAFSIFLPAIIISAWCCALFLNRPMITDGASRAAGRMCCLSMSAPTRPGRCT